uniref:BZIP domain-containing protein n=1 Tax=Heterorhabditis bacteriophora TaxID=37862 RepID=A0A1I7W8X4_HETBA
MFSFDWQPEPSFEWVHAINPRDLKQSDGVMDLRSALSALLRPVALPAVPMRPMSIPFGYSDSTLLALTKLDSSLMSVVPFTSEPSAIYTPKKARLDDSPCSPLSSNSSTVSSTQLSSPQPSPVRKIAKPIPDEKKDDAYFERRRKNNDAAKRSRDARRAKEEAIAARAAALEQDNIQLRGQV